MFICVNYQEIQHFTGSDKPRMLFFLLVNVKMPGPEVIKKIMLNSPDHEFFPAHKYLHFNLYE